MKMKAPLVALGSGGERQSLTLGHRACSIWPLCQMYFLMNDMVCSFLPTGRVDAERGEPKSIPLTISCAWLAAAVAGSTQLTRTATTEDTSQDELFWSVLVYHPR
eukprot:6336030-Amphidinium_carterae.1